MKKSLLIVALTLGSAFAFAQSGVSPNQVCQKIAMVNASNASICAQLISRNNFDQAALNLAYKAIPHSSQIALSLLQVSANRRLEDSAGKTCERVLDVNAENSIACVKAVLDTNPSPELLRVANKLVPQGSIHVVNVLNIGANAYFFAPLVDICDAMVSVNAENAVICMQDIANKVSANGSEQICRTSLNQGSAYAIQCIRGIILDYNPVPQAILVDFNQLQELRKSLVKTRALLERGILDNSKKSLEEALRNLEVIMNSSH